MKQFVLLILISGIMALHNAYKVELKGKSMRKKRKVLDRPPCKKTGCVCGIKCFYSICTLRQVSSATVTGVLLKSMRILLGGTLVGIDSLSRKQL